MATYKQELCSGEYKCPSGPQKAGHLGDTLWAASTRQNKQMIMRDKDSLEEESLLVKPFAWLVLQSLDCVQLYSVMPELGANDEFDLI